jgi:hypothetical protein|nr:MAG TPA_asm: hypothetical protein [Caudoviricetes sp.]
MIYKNMTDEQWESWKSRVQAALDTDLKEYNHFLALLMEVSADCSVNRQFQIGEKSRYMARLKEVLSRIKRMTNYPRLITKENPAKPLYIAQIPIHEERQIPGQLAPEPIPPLATPPAWNRYSDFNSYKERLSPELRQEGENLLTWFANRQRLHELSKNQVRSGVPKEEIAKTVSALDAQNEQIEAYFDRVESYMTGANPDDPDNDEDLRSRTNGKPSGSYTKEEIDQMMGDSPEFATLCKVKRIESHKKWLSRTDMKNPKSPEERALRIRELKEWGVDVSAYV